MTLAPSASTSTRASRRTFARRWRLHDLRHYAVSRLIEQGANVLLVSKGHARPSVTLDVYSHLFSEGLREAADRFDPLARVRTAALGVDER
jgi:integrase